MALVTGSNGELQASVQVHSLTKKRILYQLVLKRDTLIEHLPEKIIFNNFTDLADLMAIVQFEYYIQFTNVVT